MGRCAVNYCNEKVDDVVEVPVCETWVAPVRLCKVHKGLDLKGGKRQGGVYLHRLVKHPVELAHPKREGA